MSAIKLSARIIVAAAAVLAFIASCGQLIGDFEVVRLPNQGTDAGEPPGPLPPICTLGVTRCEGRLLQLCVEEGTAWTTLEPCATAELCESSDNSTVSACIPPTCSVDQMSCDGADLRLCNPSRTGWEPFAACESAAHCDAGRKQCLPAPCEPGDRRCNVGNLERCNDASTAWEPLDVCITNELCEQTLSPATVVGEILTTGQVPAPPPASDAEGPTSCREPVCVPREVRCDLSTLNACNEGQTALEQAEQCATAKLCDASITYTGLRGSPRCVRPLCAAGEHRCSPEGVLELCNIDRDGYDPIEACIGPPFCNAVAADNGQPGCEDAPCDPGEEQCNGPQIQRCLDDQTAFVEVGEPCQTRGLCNDDNPTAFCAPPVCQRGPFSGSEFRCEGPTLQRCNDQHTGFDTISTCATPGLCNAGLGLSGCQAPVCATGETRCSGNFVQRCNDQRTGFVNVEQCAQGTCDSAAGRCADPCIVGSSRCNTQGNLEECRNLLTGWEITARCGSLQLCDSGARACRVPPAGCTADGVRRCRTQGPGSVLEVCSDGRSRFSPLDTCTAGEICDVNDLSCDACIQGSQPTCEGNSLVNCSADGKTELSQVCANGCQTVANGPDRCRNCVPGSVSCQGAQLVVCRQRGSEEFLDREACDSSAICQNTAAACNASGTGEACRCAPGVCDPGDRDCEGSQPVVCNTDRTDFVAAGPDCGIEENCNPRPTGQCFPCGDGDVRCNAGIMQGCLPDRSGFADLENAPNPGDARCVQDNGGTFAQSCNGSQLITDACESNVCVGGSGCAQCNSAPGGFTSTCTTVNGRAGRTVCSGAGVITAVECPPGNGCGDFVCLGGACNPVDFDEGSECQLPGGGTGLCDGDPKCVQCLEDSDCPADTVACTRADCNDNSVCVQVPDNSLCGGNFCDGVETCSATQGCVAGPPATCSDGEACTADNCDPVAGRCEFPDAPGTCQLDNGQAGICSAGECVLEQTCDDAECGNVGCNDAETACNVCAVVCPDTDPCTQDVCNGNTCSHPPTCAAGELCQPDGSCIELIQGCVTNPGDCLDDNNDCNGTATCNTQNGDCIRTAAVACPGGEQCNPQDGLCAAVGCVANPGDCLDDGDACNGTARCDNLTGDCIRTGAVACQPGEQCISPGGVCQALIQGCVTDPGDCLDDGDACNGTATCNVQTGDCIRTGAVTCQPGEQCISPGGACQALIQGCVANPEDCQDDGDACNGTAVCNAQTGDCIQTDSVFCPEGQLCNPASGGCEDILELEIVLPIGN